MKCWMCKKEKLEEEFSFRLKAKGIRQSRCRSCNRKYMKGWYKANKHRVAEGNNIRHKAWSKVKKEELRVAIYAIKSRPCTDCCQIFKPWQMQFDHRDPAQKSFNVASMIQRRMPLVAILEEISKCDLVCSNCHADRTYRREHKGIN